ncbi:MAG: YraN family protein [Clostridia bacterium]|nr:YraN family protein [Clostridia bacterium]
MNKAGEWGEIYVTRYLREKGFQIAAGNFRCRFGEADIIYFDKKYLVIVEVKARGAHSIASPAEFVGTEKQRKLALTASFFAKLNHLKNPIRFDVAEVYFPKADIDDYKTYKINYIKDAFRV